MLLEKEQLKKLKEIIVSYDDLKNYALSLDLEFTEDELNDIYKQLHGELPTTLLKRVKGESLLKEEVLVLKCPICKRNMFFPVSKESAYCPHCGSKISLKKDSSGC